MQYTEYLPATILQPYVKCYYLYESGNSVVQEDTAYATGCIEMMFNLGGGQWQTGVNGVFTLNPAVELWGQVIQPLSFRSLGQNSMLGVRFYPSTARIFLQEDLSLFNNQVTDLVSVAGRQVKELQQQLLETPVMAARIQLVEHYLLNRLRVFEKKLDRVALVTDVVTELKQEDYFDNMSNLANRYGISARYLQKIFLQYTGLTPKLFGQINRFQNSLQRVAKNKQSLTDIAYECGYFDQSHFIREFKSFTGTTPSGFDIHNSSAILASANK